MLSSGGGIEGVWFGTVFNLALSTGSSPECFCRLNGERPGEDLLGSEGAWDDVHVLTLVDRFLPAQLVLSFDRPARVLRFPMVTVSQSEGGFEKAYQSSVLVPLWELRAKPGEICRLSIRVSVTVPEVVSDGVSGVR
jgi:hypothetical protein